MIIMLTLTTTLASKSRRLISFAAFGGYDYLRSVNYNLYNLSQLINVPTRITLHSETLVDLCLTTAPEFEKISVHGVIRTAKGLSDHDII